jgi:hypothetical protein
MIFMLKEKADNLKLKHLKHVLKPMTRGTRLREENYIDVGFDTEYTSEDDSSKHTLLSLQFSLGRGRSAIYYVNRVGGIASRELLDYTLKFLESQNVEPKKSIYLIVYFGLAELSCISDFCEAYDTPEGYKVYPNINEYNKIVL